MSDVRVGIVRNRASSLVQGVEFHRGARDCAVGPQNRVCAGSADFDARFTAAFDVHARKTGRDLSEVIGAAPNNARVFAEVPHLGVPVSEGALSDGKAPPPARQAVSRPPAPDM
jgi:myo-inositol-1-phosphate synthase